MGNPICSKYLNGNLRRGHSGGEQVFEWELKAWSQWRRELLQAFEAEVVPLTEAVYPMSPEYFRERKAASAFINSIEDEQIHMLVRISRHENSRFASAQVLELEIARKKPKPIRVLTDLKKL